MEGQHNQQGGILQARNALPVAQGYLDATSPLDGEDLEGDRGDFGRSTAKYGEVQPHIYEHACWAASGRTTY